MNLAPMQIPKISIISLLFYYNKLLISKQFVQFVKTFSCFYSTLLWFKVLKTTDNTIGLILIFII
jgi:hypothetical protein